MENKKLPTVCIVGRTNVGKSTLFNALYGRRKAVVKDMPGVTRDRFYETVNRFGFPFTLIDTGALVGEDGMSLQASVVQQTELAMKESDLLIVVFDGLHGLHPQDSEVFKLVRLSSKPVIWVANKCEKPSSELTATEIYGLGIEDLICVSAAHRRGMTELVKRIQEKLQLTHQLEEPTGFGPADAVPPSIRMAVVGKPNVGKSTLVNRMIGEDRMIVSPIAGTTRDSISAQVKRNGKVFEIVDTAGLRKKAGVSDGTVERFSNLRTLRTLAQSDVAIFLIDASEGIPTEQDAKIVGLVHEKGKGLVVVVNKWDLIEKDGRTAEAFRVGIKRALKFAQYAPVVFVSALTGQRCPNILDEVIKVNEARNFRIKTSDLNDCLHRAFSRRPPPVYRGSPVKLLYATQVATAPPTLAVFVNYPERLNFAYERYIKNSIRAEYPFEGNDVRVVFKRRSQLSTRNVANPTS